MTETPTFPRHDYGPLQSFEITWTSGHVETIQAHQVSWPGSLPAFFGQAEKTPRIQFHGEIDGRWTLVLSALEADLTRIRNVTQTEAAIAPEADAS
jgi:hypothetical protein